MEPDYLIVGSGLASLSFAALMANAGQRVRILEAHDRVGGYGHTFEEGGRYRFNAQLHYVWNCGEGRTVARFLDRLGLREEVTFERYDPTGYDHMRMPGYALDIPADYDELARRLTTLFPAHGEGFAGFLEEVQRTDAELEALPSSVTDVESLIRGRGYLHVLRNHRATLGEVFTRFALPTEARTLIAMQWPDFLLPPRDLSFFAWVKLFAGYARGAYYPSKHFHHVVDTLRAFIESHGGEVLCGQRVTAFLREGRAVRGVRAEAVTESGQGTSEVTEHTGRAVVCNMDPQRAAAMIGFEHFAPLVRQRLQYDYSPSNFMAYCVVEGIDLREHGFGRWNLFHCEQPDLDACFDAMYERGDYSRPSFAVTTPTLISDDPGDCPPGQQLLELLTVAHYDRFHPLRIGNARAYRHAKQAVLDSMLDILERDYVPDLREHLVVKMTGSPTTNERFVGSPRGNSYGSNLTPQNVGLGRLDERTSLDGFYFCNASSGYPGFTGTIWTGARLYEKLSGDRFLR